MSTVPLQINTAPDLLFLAPCLPYPPDRGDRLRWYQMLRHLSQRYRVHFGCVADPRTPAALVSRIKALCYETCFVTPPSLATRLRTLGERHRLDQDLAGWTTRLLRNHPVQAALACSAGMAPYLALANSSVARVADFVDMESASLRRRAAAHAWPARLRWQREAQRLEQVERQAAEQLDYILFASGAAAGLFCAQASAHAHKARTIANGVDADYFSPHILHRNPYGPGCRALVFTGAMDDWANAEGAEWFARRVFAGLRDADPTLHFYIVGARPGPRLRRLAKKSGVVVTGAVPDVRPYLAHAALAVAPVQSSHGIQNKVLEAMAMQKAVLATPAALAGIQAVTGTEVLQAVEPGHFAREVRAALRSNSLPAIGKAARARVLQDYSWSGSLARLDDLLGAPARLHASVT